jgi:transcriptional regulator with XRE-family HTH domain
VTVDGRGPGAGGLLRDWRRRRLTQLEFAVRAGVSARHLSFVETGRSAPSRELLLRLADRLELPLRERNRLLLAAGYAPVYGESPLGSPRLAALREAIHHVLAGHEPYPAVVVDRGWHLVDGNSGVALLTEGVAPELLEPPANVLRIALHPRGLAPRIENLGQWRAHLLHRLRAQAEASGDAHPPPCTRSCAATPAGRRRRWPPTRWSCRCGSGTAPRCCPSPARSPRSARRWM